MESLDLNLGAIIIFLIFFLLGLELIRKPDRLLQILFKKDPDELSPEEEIQYQSAKRISKAFGFILILFGLFSAYLYLTK